MKTRTIFYRGSVCASLVMSTVLFSACSSPSKDDSSTTTTSLFKTKETAKTSNDVPTYPQSEAGVGNAAFRYASAFIVNKKGWTSNIGDILSSGSRDDIAATLSQQQENSSGEVSFSPVGYTVDEYSNTEAKVAVVGIAFTSNGVARTAKWKEIYFIMRWENRWLVDNFTISNLDDIIGAKGNLSELGAPYLEGFTYPSDLPFVGGKPILNKNEGSAPSNDDDPEYRGE